MACGTSLVKYILFFFNFIFVLGGGALIVVGALLYTEQTKYLEIVDLGKFQGPPIAMMVFGSIMFIIAFMGCCGALQESNCMMMTYATFLFIMLGVQVAVVVAAMYYKDDFNKLINDGLSASIKNYGQPEYRANTEAWDSIQQNLKCCGVNSFRDWSFLSVPDSCCITQRLRCAAGTGIMPEPIARLTIFTEGCVPKVQNKLGSENIVYAGLTLAAVELLGIIFACCLGARFRNKSYQPHY